MASHVAFIDNDTAASNRVPAEWLNDVNAVVWDVLNGATTVALARTALGLGTADAPLFAGITLSGAAIGGVTQAVFNSVSTTVNAFGAAITLNIGNASGTNTILGATTFSQGVTLSAALTYGGVALTNAVTGTGKMVLDTSPSITTSLVTASTTFALINTTATTINFASGASVALNIGNASGTNTVAGATSFSQTVSPLGLVDASGASAGQIKFPATQNASANANTLDDYAESTAAVALSGCTTAPTGTYYATKIGNTVTIDFWPGTTVTATSNSASKGFTAIAAALRPTSAKRVIGLAADNGGSYVACAIILATDGTLTIQNGLNSGTWTASGTFTITDFSMSYTLN